MRLTPCAAGFKVVGSGHAPLLTSAPSGLASRRRHGFQQTALGKCHSRGRSLRHVSRGVPGLTYRVVVVRLLTAEILVHVIAENEGIDMPRRCHTLPPRTRGKKVTPSLVPPSCEKCPRSSGTRVPTGTCVESVAFLAGTGHVLCSTECQASSLTSACRPDIPPAPCVSPSRSLVEGPSEETCAASRSHLVVDGRGTPRRCKSFPRRALRELELCHARANRSRWSRTVLGSRLLRTWSR